MRLARNQWRLGVTSRFQLFRVPSKVADEPGIRLNSSLLLNRYAFGQSISVGYGILPWLQLDLSSDYSLQRVTFWEYDLFENQQWQTWSPLSLQLTAHVFQEEDDWQLSIGMGAGMPLTTLSAQSDSNEFAGAGGWNTSAMYQLGWRGEVIQLTSIGQFSYRMKDESRLAPGWNYYIGASAAYVMKTCNAKMSFGGSVGFSALAQMRREGYAVLNTGGSSIAVGALCNIEWNRWAFFANVNTPVWQYLKGQQSTQLVQAQVGFNVLF